MTKNIHNVIGIIWQYLNSSYYSINSLLPKFLKIELKDAIHQEFIGYIVILYCFSISKTSR